MTVPTAIENRREAEDARRKKHEEKNHRVYSLRFALLALR
jgi:hypothetical protein